MRLNFASFTLAIAIMFGPSTATAQLLSTTQLTPHEVRLTAANALQTGNSARALALAEALLLRDPDEIFALRIAGRAALDIGQSDVAAERARHLYRVADEKSVRFFAARLVALAETQQENYTTAQLWLRRARQNAPDEGAERQISSDYQSLRQRNPLQFSLNFGVSPSSNINSGSSQATQEIIGIDFALSADAQALSGLQYSASGQLSYRLSESQTQRTRLLADFNVLRYSLSDESRDDAPDFDVGTLAYDRVSIGVQHERLIGRSFELNRPVTARLNYGYSRLDGASYAQDINAGLSTQWALGAADRIIADLSVGHVTYSTTNNTANSWDTALTWQRRLANDDSISVTVNAGHTDSSNRTSLINSRQGIAASYDFGRIWDSVDFSVSLQKSWRSFEPSTVAPDGREDVKTTGAISLGLPSAEFYGFSPVVRVEASDTTSNAGRFQMNEVTLDIGFRSNF